MNAVIKPVADTEEKTDIAVIEEKSLDELLAIGDVCPADFYKNPDYLKQVKTAKLLAGSLVHTIDDQGRADSKKDAAAIRKFVKTTNSFTLNIFRSLTEKVTNWRDEFTVETKELGAIADGIDAKFKKMEQEKLDSIKLLLGNFLSTTRDELGIKPDFRKEADLKTLLKLSGTLTDKGNLTSKATAFIKSIADAELAQQNRYENRVMIIENRCLRAEINPPLTQVHLGAVMFAEDDVFNTKVEELVNAEIERREQMSERIKKQAEVENKKKLDDALAAQKQEVMEQAREQVKSESPVSTQSEPQKTETPIKQVAETPVGDGKKSVIVTAQFRIRVKQHISAQSVANYLVDSKLSDELKEALIECTAVDHG